MDPRDEYVREMARLYSYIPRTLEANELRIVREVSRSNRLLILCIYPIFSIMLKLRWSSVFSYIYTILVPSFLIV